MSEETANNIKYKRYTLTILVSCVICEIITFPILVIYWREQRKISLAHPSQQKMCYPQHKLETGDDRNVSCPDGLALKIDKTNKTSNCCGEMSKIFNSALKKITSERYDSDINPEMIFFDLKQFSCVATQKQIPTLSLTWAVEKNSVPVHNHFKVSWKRHPSSVQISALSFLENEDTVLVEETGFYYILSQLTLKVDKTFVDSVGHSVHALSDNSSTSVLLEDTLLPCQLASDALSAKTSVIGAVFKLNQGDRLCVATSHPNIIKQGKYRPPPSLLNKDTSMLLTNISTQLFPNVSDRIKVWAMLCSGLPAFLRKF